jgi:hypothetical protein
MKCLKLAKQLSRDLLKICPDSQVDPEGARGNVAARVALRCAIEMIEHNQPEVKNNPTLDGYWAGMIDAACRLISAVEMEMYDPRLHPERYV